MMDFDTAQPIYRQIMDDYKKKLIRGELKGGDRIPSQREYADLVKVNPNTVQRAYREMEAMKMVETVRGQGTFISVDDAMLAQIKEDMALAILSNFVDGMKSLGFADHDLVGLLGDYLTKEAESK